MLDLTSYRRKQKYIKPIHVMRQFYHSYSKSISSKQFSNTSKDHLIKPTLLLSKFDRFFKELQSTNHQSQENTLQNTFRDQKKFRTKMFNTSSSSKFVRDNGSSKSLNCFDSQFTKNVGIFRVHPYIKMLHHANNKENQDRQNNDQPTLLASNKITNIRNPTKLFLQMRDLKYENEKRADTCRKKLRRIRQNWIVNHLYHHSQEEKQREPTKITLKFKEREMFNQTKENIFPSGRTIY